MGYQDNDVCGVTARCKLPVALSYRRRESDPPLLMCQHHWDRKCEREGDYARMNPLPIPVDEGSADYVAYTQQVRDGAACLVEEAARSLSLPASLVTCDSPPPFPIRKMTILEAAKIVLEQSDRPLSSQEMIVRMRDGGLWSSRARTPARTLWSAMYQDMKKSDSPFVKVGANSFKVKG